MQLEHRKIVLGICGGIAAYKCPELCRLLQKQGADVYTVVTASGAKLVSTATLQALSGHPVGSEVFTAADNIGHIELCADADCMVIAPATANTIAKLAHGLADNMLTAAALAAPCPLIIAPAMNSRMYRHPATQANLEILKQRGVFIIPPADGPLACGESGIGRMREPAEIAAYICALLNRHGLPFAENTLLPKPDAPRELTAQKLLPTASGAGLRVLITAGPTEEPIDPVRVITNKSSGKMGFALAQAARERGAEVTLIAGPVHLPTPAQVNRINVKTAQDMYDAVKAKLDDVDIVIGCAAVSDYRLAYVYPQKLKKETQGDSLTLTLIKNEDIIAMVGHANPRPFTVGFAAETMAGEAQAKEKLARKNLDLIALNDVSRSDVGFNSDDNALTIFDRDGKIADLPKAPKAVIAAQLTELIFNMVQSSRGTASGNKE